MYYLSATCLTDKRIKSLLDLLTYQIYQTVSLLSYCSKQRTCYLFSIFFPVHKYRKNCVYLNFVKASRALYGTHRTLSVLIDGPVMESERVQSVQRAGTANIPSLILFVFYTLLTPAPNLHGYKLKDNALGYSVLTELARCTQNLIEYIHAGDANSRKASRPHSKST